MLKARALSIACCSIKHRLLQLVLARAVGHEHERLRLELLGEGLHLEQGVDEHRVVTIRLRDTGVPLIPIRFGRHVALPVEVVVRAHTVDEFDALGVVAHEALVEAERNLEGDIIDIPAAKPKAITHARAEIEQLESLAEALLDFTTLNDLVLWLNRYGL